MLRVINDPTIDAGRRDRMAVAAAPYVHVKKGEGGKKDTVAANASKASGGKFAPAGAPRLVSSR
jgi:phage terminase small subunit